MFWKIICPACHIPQRPGYLGCGDAEVSLGLEYLVLSLIMKVHLWGDGLTFLSLSLFIYKMGINTN